MKTVSFLPLALAALIASSAVAQIGPPKTGFESLKVLELVEPVFPTGVELYGITKGAVRCVIDVDEKGKLEDVLITDYSHPGFARTVREAMRLWRFAPAKLNGSPVPTQTTIQFNIEAVGVVVTIDAFSQMGTRMPKSWDSEYSYRPSLLKEIDHIPIPLQTVVPHYNPEWTELKGTGRVTVSFYIDETGKVRVPIVTASSDPLLSSVAIDAVRQWRFEPPIRHGRPTLVFASQEFIFEKTPPATPPDTVRSPDGSTPPERKP